MFLSTKTYQQITVKMAKAFKTKAFKPLSLEGLKAFKLEVTCKQTFDYTWVSQGTLSLEAVFTSMWG